MLIDRADATPPRAASPWDRLFRTIASFPAGTQLFAPGGWGRRVLLVRRGWVRIYQREPAGREVRLARLGAGRMVGAASVFSAAGDGPYAEAETDVEAGVAEGASFARLAGAPSAALRILVEELAAAVIETDEHIAELGGLEGRERLLRLLRQIGQAQGARVDGGWRVADLPRQVDLGREIGLTRETVTRLFARLEKQGAIARGGGMLTVFE